MLRNHLNHTPVQIYDSGKSHGFINDVIMMSLFRYFIRVVVVRRLSDLVKERDLAVHTVSSFPDMINSLKMEVGIEDCLHIEFEYNKSK